MCLTTYGTYIISFNLRHVHSLKRRLTYFRNECLYFLCIFSKIICFLKSQEARRRLHIARDRCLDSNKMQYIKSGKEESEKKSIKSSNNKAVSNAVQTHLVGG